MNAFLSIEELDRWQGKLVRWMTGLSLLFHAGLLLLSSVISPYFPARVPPPVVIVELTEAPLSDLPKEKPPPPPKPSPVPKETIAAKPVPAPLPKTAPPSEADKWLRKLDAALPKVQDAPVAMEFGKPGGIPVRQWENEAAPRPGDFAPAIAPENSALLRQIANLEGKVRSSGVGGVGTGKEIDAAVMFGGVGTSRGETIPEWIREMIRRKVQGYLPELEAAYSAAYRRNPELKGKLVVRFRIDPSGRIVGADSAESSFRDSAFIATILGKVRRWTFDPTGGRTVEVLYPFVFIAPS